MQHLVSPGVIAQSVIIPSYKAPHEVLRRCLKSVLAQLDLRNSEIIVVDSSSDNLHELERDFREVKFIKSGRTMYAGEARNEGAKLAHGAHLIFLDSDCVWNEAWFQAYQSLLARKDWDVACGFIDFENRKSLWAFSLHLFEFHEFFGNVEHFVRFATSGNMVISRELFLRSGGFKPNWQACEDIGFQSGEVRLRVLYDPKLAITHQAHLVSKEEIFKKIRLMGYWRALYDRELQREFRIFDKISYRVIRPVLGVVFALVIILRSLRGRSQMRGEVLRNAWRILRMALIWAEGFGAGIKGT